MMDILYIAGAGRSGSTLLERILGQLEGCVAVGELRHLWRDDPATTLCGCGRFIAECDFWLAALVPVLERFDQSGFRAMLEAQQSVDRIRYVPAMRSGVLANRKFRLRQAQYCGHLRHMYQAFLATSGDAIVVDSSKDISTLHLLAAMPDVRVRILHLVRDSRAVAYAWTKEKVRPNVVGQLTYMVRYSPRQSAADWMVRNLLTEAARGSTAGYMRVRYEDLIANPRRTVTDIAAFLQLTGADLSFIGASGIEFPKENHAIGGNPMRFAEGEVRLQLDSAWKEQIRPMDRRIVTALSWPLLQRYKYL